MEKNCQTCGEEFNGHFNQKHCRIVKIKLCKYKKCCNYYTYNCGIRHGNFCSIKCQSYYISQETNANIKRSKAHQDNKELYRNNYLKSMEKKYGVGVTNPSQILEVKDKRRQFLLNNPNHFKNGLKDKFGEDIENISQLSEYKDKIRESNRIAQNTFETKLKILESSYPYIRNSEEYLILDFIEWAKSFEKINKINPTPMDLQLYFNFKSPINIPYEAKEYFNLKDSSLEVYFKNILTEEFKLTINEDFYRRKRFLKNEVTGGCMELDFLLPEYMLAFEINDNATHSKDSDYAFGAFQKLKNGPKYSQNKRELAGKYGVILIEIWEDELTFNNKEKLINKIGEILKEFKPTKEVVTIYENKLKNGELLPLPKGLRKMKWSD